MKNKPTIAVDIDDVLAANAAGFVQFSNKRWGTSLTPEDYTEHWYELWKVDKEEGNKRARYLYSSDLFRRYEHFTEAEQVLKKLAKRFELVVVTSRHRAVSSDTIDWIDRHFQGIFSDIHFAGIWDDLEKESYQKLQATKAELTRQIGADYLIDDQPKHCFAAAKAGLKALLFGDYSWNRGVKLPKNVSRVKNWQAVLEYFDEQNRR